MKFNKPPLSVPDQLAKLQSRGLGVVDHREAEHHLRFIGYYRLSAYALPFQQAHLPNKPFQNGTSFEDILALYRFDRELRLLAMDAVERIEVAARSTIVNEMCLRHGSHWFMDSRHFSPRYRHAELILKIESELGIRASGKLPSRAHTEVFINHYYAKYGDPHLPPAWVVGEILSLGTWSLVYANLQLSAERQAIASHFGVNEAVLKNWLHVLNYARNICAHHARLWNRQLVIKILIAKKHQEFLSINDRFYAMVVVMFELLKQIAPDTEWAKRLADLLNSHPKLDLRAMGFPSDWKKQPFWKLTVSP